MISCHFENGNKVGLRHAVVGVIINKDNKILLCKRGTFKGKPILESGKWDVIGGFVDRDETLIQAVKRETMEESGWQINNIRLFRINDNPNRPNDNNRQNISVIFVADAVSQTNSSTEEVAGLSWFGLDKLPHPNEIAFDHSEDIALYKKFITKKFPLPVFGLNKS